MPPAIAKPIFGVIARTQSGRDHLSAIDLQPWVSRWISTPDPQAWWINTKDGVAIFHPDMQMNGNQPGEESCISIRGSVIADRINPPRRLPPSVQADGLSLLLGNLIERGLSTLRDLRGQFSIVYWDGERRMLCIARDHLGQRCMYTRTDPNYILFCSELGPLLQSPAFGTQLNEEAAYGYLAFGMPPNGQTLAKNVDRIPAAHALCWEANTPVQVRRYWTPLHPEAAHEASPEFVAQCREQLELSIVRKLSGTDDQGLFLSGGVDSTFIAATARKNGATLQSFTSAFDEKYGINETEYASGVAQWLNFPNYVIPVAPKQALDTINDVVLAAAEPCSAWASVTHFHIQASAQQMRIRTMFSGLGADEIFGGYDHFRGYYARYCRYTVSHPAPAGMDPFNALLMDESRSASRVLYPGVARLFDDASLQKSLTAPFGKWHYASYLREFYRECRRIKPEANVMEMMVAHECQHRIPDLLHANFDPISRRIGIENIYPFLDPDLIQLVCGLSVTSRYRTPSGQFSLRLRELMPRFKYAMMKIAEDRVPAAILERPRSSYTAPFGQWLFHPDFSNPLLDKLQRSRFWDSGIVNKDYMREILAKVVPGPNPWVFQMWGLLTLAGWYDKFVEGGK